MSKVVKIPDCMNPFVVTLNGVAYSYPAGSEVEVPDEVALVIENHNANHKKEPEGVAAPFGCGGGGTGGSVQSDWNQTDDTQPDFIRNKPFGDVAEEILPFGEVEFVFSEEDGGAIFVTEYSGSLYNGDYIKVNWDGVIYETMVLDTGAFIVFGNIVIMGGEDTGEPFTGMYQDGMVIIMDLTSMESVVRSISVSKVVKEKISAEYLPGAITTYHISFDTTNKNVYSDVNCTKLVSFERAGMDVIYGTISLQVGSTPIRINPTICQSDGNCVKFECAGDWGTYQSAKLSG